MRSPHGSAAVSGGYLRWNLPLSWERHLKLAPAWVMNAPGPRSCDLAILRAVAGHPDLAMWDRFRAYSFRLTRTRYGFDQLQGRARRSG
jgi:hypothetical protein